MDLLHRRKEAFLHTVEKVMRHLAKSKHSWYLADKGQVVGTDVWNVAFVTNYICDQNIFYRGGGTVFPALLCVDGIIQSNFSEEELNKLLF